MAEFAIELENCSYTYDGRVRALREVSCAIEAGSWVALLGQNGSGKTTLAKLCNGLLRPQEGRVRINGVDIRDRSVGSVAGEVGYLFQNPDHQIFAPTVREEIAFGLRNLGFPAAEREQRLQSALEAFDLKAYADHPPAVLGFGLRRQVTVASLFACSPPILILDEATQGLDWARSQRLLDRLQELQDGGHTILFVTHDVRLVAERASHVMVLHHGELLAEGPVQEILARRDSLARASVSPPPITQLSQLLSPWGMKGSSLTVEDFYCEYAALLGERGRV